jgi:hypothetical protein
MPDRLTIQPGQITIRHVRLRQSSDPVSPDGAVVVLGKTYIPVATGINGRRGFASGSYERRLNEEGQFTLRFPNAAGDDGVLHRNRFLILLRGRRLSVPASQVPTSMVESGTFYSFQGGNYRPGDEWIEIWRGEIGVGDLLYVGTPTSATVTQTDIQISGFDAVWLMKKIRATAADFWTSAPRDVIEHYCSAWTTVVAEDFAASGPVINNDTDTIVATSEVIGGVTYNRLDTVRATMPGTGVLRLKPGNITVNARVRNVGTFSWGVSGTAPSRFQGWRVEASLYLPAFNGGECVGLFDYGAAAGAYMQINNNGTVSLLATGYTTKIVRGLTIPGSHSIAVEGRGRWVYYYLDGVLVGIMPMPNGSGGGVGFVQKIYATGSATDYVDVDSFIVRRTQPFLLRGSTGGSPADPGDYKLPGAPTPGGLVGSYFADLDIKDDPNFLSIILNPARTAAATRLDPGAFISVAAPLPPAVSNYFSARWTGAINLDLATTDRFLRLIAPTGGGTINIVRIYVGKTRIGEEYTSTTGYGPSLRGILGNITGWYPIRIEVQWSAYTPGTLQLEWATSAGGAGNAIVPTANLSPLGTFNQAIRYESHYDVLLNVTQSNALQWRLAPKSLESGLFPGQIIPRVREGRDTEKVIDSVEATQIAVQINAEEVADSLFADAQGLADPTGKAQLTLEGQNYSRLEQPGLPELERHLTIASEYETLSEISVPTLLRQRLDSLLALRGSAWENAAAQPAGFREYVDKFPLAGSYAEFAWEPGDGVRLSLNVVGVEDASPRQILGVQREFVPDGLRRPVVSFRQRPRDLSTLLRAMQRDAIQQQRYYQNQFVSVSGTLGGNGSGVGDAYTRATLPLDLAAVVNATMVVQYKSDTSTWNVEVNDTNRLTITAAGRYDVTPWIDRVNNEPKMYARCTGGTGYLSYNLELIVRV